MRLTTHRIAVFTVLLTLLIGSTTTEAQRRRKRAIRPNITAAKVRNDLVGQQINGVPSSDGARIGSWRFVEDEWKEVDVLEAKAKGSAATVAIKIRTGGVSGELAGMLRLHYEQGAGKWVLNWVENLTAKIHPDASAGSRPQQDNSPRQPENATYHPIVNTAFTVSAGSYHYFNFQVSGHISIIGEFRASGGGGNDIEVYVLDDVQYVNFANGHATPTFYNSGRVTVSRLNAPLRPGNYVLVFNNRYSLFTPKAITANIGLWY